MKRRILIGVFLATMVVSLAGCGASKETKTTSTESTTVKEFESVSSTEPTTVKEVETKFTAEGKSCQELYDALDEDLLSLEPMDASMFYIGYRSEPYTRMPHNQGNCYISGILYSTTSSNNLMDVKSEQDIYDIVVLPSVDYRNEIDSVSSELPESNIVTKGNKTFVYKHINEMARIVVIPNSVERVEGGAFECGRNNVLERVVLPDSVKSIGASAFSGCDRLTKINLPASIEEISPVAFRYEDSDDEWVDKITVTVDKDSYAEAYCKEYNIKFVYREE